jgi:hypothetical protein
MSEKILLVEPDFPIADKSRNHSHFLPIGLLKIGSYHQSLGDRIQLVRGLKECSFNPDRILVTSLFTYWSNQVHEAANFYHKLYPSAKLEIGGIYASLMPEDCRRRSPFADVQIGLYRGGCAENVPIDYKFLPEKLDYQIIHASRGCIRHCSFCGTWRIEPNFTSKATILPEIKKRRLVFYDNNLLANPNIENILSELTNYRFRNGKSVIWECQSGLDLRLLTPERAELLKKSHMINPRIAWDGPFSNWPLVKHTIDMLKAVGYGRKDIFVFMIYNHALPYIDMLKKVDACRRWRVRLIDCRYRPLNSIEDNYIPGSKSQPTGSYFLHRGWTDATIRRFRRKVRHQNIAILLDLPNGRYIPGCESRKV